MKIFQKYLNHAIIFCLLIATVVTGCSKAGEANKSDETIVQINLLGSISNVEDDVQGKVGKQGSSDNNAVQTTVIPFDDHFSIVATLSPVGATAASLANRNDTQSPSDVVSSRAATTPLKSNLAANVQYKVMVYDAAGDLKAQEDYSFGNEASKGGIVLNAGVTYTFVAYSINSTSGLPTVTNENKLNTATVTNVTGDLMYFKETKKVNHGINNLNVVLKHKFSQIVTKVSLDQSSSGMVTAISAPVFNSTYNSADIKLATGDLTYNTLTTNGIPVSFGTVNSRSVTALPTQLISPAVTNGVFNIGSITMNGLTKGNVSVPNLRINPGCKYNLNIVFVAPCTATVNSDLVFSVKDGQTKSFSAPSADFGFVFDLFEIDNSFNLRINNVMITNQEIQFEGGQGAVGGQNLKFADNVYWGNSNIPQIYNMKGTTGKPIIRIYIDVNGKISMFGSKVSNGPLFPLVLSGTAAFNTVTWNKTGSNTVVASQSVRGQTHLIGEGYGKRIVPCQ